MKISKFFLVGIFGSLLFNPSLKAGYDSWGYVDNNGIKFYKVNSLTGSSTLVSDECDFKSVYGNCYTLTNIQFNEGTNKIEYKSYINRSGKKEWQGTFEGENDTAEQWFSYDLNTGTKTKISAPWQDGYTGSGSLSKIFQSSDGTINIQVGEDKLVSKKANGELHIGENSWITKEENGRQKVWAKDAEGNAIPIDYTNGTKLLINGRDVEQSINNVGALSAALTGLPTVPTETNLSCGLGTGTHGGDFAFSGGCASKVNEKLSINYAASMTIPGQDYAGDFEDTFSARAGFVWKLGKSFKPTQISFHESKELKKEVKDLKAKNDEIITQNQKLLARLEKLENIAFKFQSSSEMISVATKD